MVSFNGTYRAYSAIEARGILRVCACHHCERSGEPQAAGRTCGACLEIFCEQCLEAHYPNFLESSKPRWKCPKCRGVCLCGVCERKLELLLVSSFLLPPFPFAPSLFPPFISDLWVYAVCDGVSGGVQKKGRKDAASTRNTNNTQTRTNNWTVTGDALHVTRDVSKSLVLLLISFEAVV